MMSDPRLIYVILYNFCPNPTETKEVKPNEESDSRLTYLPIILQMISESIDQKNKRHLKAGW
jgi:hypothetical protein